MKTRTTLTKSLHTVSAVTRVAMHLATLPPYSSRPAGLAFDAAHLLGLAAQWSESGDTEARCIASVAAELSKRPAREYANAARLHAAVSAAVGGGQ